MTSYFEDHDTCVIVDNSVEIGDFSFFTVSSVKMKLQDFRCKNRKKLIQSIRKIEIDFHVQKKPNMLK